MCVGLITASFPFEPSSRFQRAWSADSHVFPPLWTSDGARSLFTAAISRAAVDENGLVHVWLPARKHSKVDNSSIVVPVKIQKLGCWCLSLIKQIQSKKLKVNYC